MGGGAVTAASPPPAVPPAPRLAFGGGREGVGMFWADVLEIETLEALHGGRDLYHHLSSFGQYKRMYSREKL